MNLLDSVEASKCYYEKRKEKSSFYLALHSSSAVLESTRVFSLSRFLCLLSLFLQFATSYARFSDAIWYRVTYVCLLSFFPPSLLFFHERTNYGVQCSKMKIQRFKISTRAHTHTHTKKKKKRKRKEEYIMATQRACHIHVASQF